MIHRTSTRGLRATCSLLVLLSPACGTDGGGAPDASTGTGGEGRAPSGGGSTSASGGANSGGGSGGGGVTSSNGGASAGGATASGGVSAGNGGASSGGVTAGSGGSQTDAGSGGSADGGADTDGGRSFSTDRTAFFGDSRCAAARVQFCEDFESGSLSSWKLTGTPTIDGVQKARGQKALHVKVASGSKVAIETDKIFPETDNVYYGRAFVYFASLPTPVGSTTYAHWTFIAATGDNVSGEIRLSGQMSNGINHFGVGTDNGTATGTGDWTNSDNDPKGAPRTVPLNQWLCIEWMHDGAKNETRFYWDDAEHPSLYTSSSMHGGNKNPYILPKFRRVWLGLQEYQQVLTMAGAPEQYELWIDEVALDHARIGCVL